MVASYPPYVHLWQPKSHWIIPLLQRFCSIEAMFCIPANYSKFNPPLNPPGDPPSEVTFKNFSGLNRFPSVATCQVQIGLDNFEILKIDDRDFTIEINAYFIVKWRDRRLQVNMSQIRKHFSDLEQVI